MKELNCPSCGAALELPDNLGAAHCMYCGAKILIEQSDATREQQDLRRSIELCKVALEARNYTETIQYCNRILGIDSRNVDAWIDKAIATSWLTTAEHNGYDEARGYLKRAAQIAPGDDRISRAEEELTRSQAEWYNHLGDESLRTTLILWDIYSQAGMTSGKHAVPGSLDLFNKAMDYYLMAARFAPEDMTILRNIEHVTEVPGSLITWGDEVHKRLNHLSSLRARSEAETVLPGLRAELAQAQADLAEASKQTGLFSTRRIKAAEKRVADLKASLATNESAAAFSIPED